MSAFDTDFGTSTVLRPPHPPVATVPQPDNSTLAARSRTSSISPANQSFMSNHSSLNAQPVAGDWSLSSSDKLRYLAVYEKLEPKEGDGSISGMVARATLQASKLPDTDLMKAWGLADHNDSGKLSKSQFCICMHLIYKALAGQPIPAVLPPEMRSSVTDLSGEAAASMPVPVAQVSPSSTIKPSSGNFRQASPLGPKPGYVSSVSSVSSNPAATAPFTQAPAVPPHLPSSSNRTISATSHTSSPLSSRRGTVAPQADPWGGNDTAGAAFPTSFDNIPPQTSAPGANFGNSFGKAFGGTFEQSSVVSAGKLPHVATQIMNPPGHRLERTGSLLSNQSLASVGSNPSGSQASGLLDNPPKLTPAESKSSINSSTASSPYYVPADKMEQYKRIFDKEKTVDDFIEGAAARSIFIQSALPHEFLGQVWNLVDLEQTGRLSEPQFVMAMHFLCLKLVQNIPPPLSLSAQEILDFSSGSSREHDQFQDPEDLTETLAEIEELKKQRESLSISVRSKEEELNQIRRNTEQLNDSINEVDMLITNLTTEKGRKQRQIDQRQVEASECKVEKEDMIKKKDQLKQALLAKQNAVMVSKGQQQQHSTDEDKLQRLIQAIASIRPKLAADEYEHNRGTMKIVELEQEIASFTAEISNMEKEKDITQSNIQHYASKMTELQTAKEEKLAKSMSQTVHQSTSIESGIPEHVELAESVVGTSATPRVLSPQSSVGYGTKETVVSKPTRPPSAPVRPASRPLVEKSASPFEVNRNVPSMVTSSSIFQMATEDGQLMSDMKADMSEKDMNKSAAQTPTDPTTTAAKPTTTWANGFDDEDPFTAVSHKPTATASNDAWAGFDAFAQPPKQASAPATNTFNPFGDSDPFAAPAAAPPTNQTGFDAFGDSSPFGNSGAVATPAVQVGGFDSDPFGGNAFSTDASGSLQQAKMASLQQQQEEERLRLEEEAMLRQALENSKREQ